MKRIALLTLTLLYVTTFSGVSINMHYCMGELVNWDFSHVKDQNCSGCGMTESESKGCCEDKQMLLKVDTDQKIANAPFQIPLFSSSPALVNSPFAFTFANVPTLIGEHPVSNAPPQRCSVPIYVRNCLFLI